MIKKEFFGEREDRVKLYRTFSDNNLKIRKCKTSEVYEEAIDTEDSLFEYEETDMPLEEHITEENANQDPAQVMAAAMATSMQSRVFAINNPAAINAVIDKNEY